MICGLLGQRLDHSWSPLLHSRLTDAYRYTLFPVEPEQVGAFLRSGAFDGLNVTIPYKKTVIPFLDEISTRAAMIGAVNTVVRRPDGTLYGDNTDGEGFLWLLQKAGVSLRGKKVLVLGSGGASAAVCHTLGTLGALPTVISRKRENHYGNLSLHRDAFAIVNATPVGMYPGERRSPVDFSEFPSLHLAADLVYHPTRTAFLLQAQALGIPSVGGLPMLVAQAKASAELFTGCRIDDRENERVLQQTEAAVASVVLIGMPGSGKTTVGGILARRLGKPFFDTDRLIEEKAGKPIPRIFSEDGEAVFRAWEHDVIEDVCRETGRVISVGGGAPLREDNRDAMRQNAAVVFLERDPDRLSRKGRPLSESADLSQMLRERLPCYRAAADATIRVRRTPEETADAVFRVLYGVQ